MTFLLLVHITSATLGVLSALLAMSLRKGSGLHGAAGTLFSLSMLVMSATGAYLGAFVKPVMITVIVGLLTFYLVATGWMAASRKGRAPGFIDIAALLFAMIIGAASLISGIEASSSPNGCKDQIPAGFYFFYGCVALLFAASDVRMVARGGVFGSRRIARHVWRMCFAILISTLSLFPGPQRLVAQLLRETAVPWLPHLLLIASMIFWISRLSGNGHPRTIAIETRP